MEGQFKIDVNKLRDIAVSTAAENAVLEGAEIASAAREAELEKQEIRLEAATLVQSIPAELEEAAKTPIVSESGRTVQAMIPIVRESLSSCMDFKGHLSTRERKLLSVVRKMVSGESIEGAEIFIHRETKEGSYSNIDGDTAEGPCKHYYTNFLISRCYP